ncbi:hypothetical protein N5P37_003130 [Trichoderma harzianum]|nr:hypothetical protein N5P37_003130 [Trichoderma harzianum]
MATYMLLTTSKHIAAGHAGICPPWQDKKARDQTEEAQSPAQAALFPDWIGAIAIGSWPTTGAAQVLGSTQTGHATLC